MKQTSILVLLLILFSLTIQAMGNTDLFALLMKCECNHSSNAETHSMGRKQSSGIQIPDCHNSANKQVPHVCSCKNGNFLKKINSYLSQLIFFPTPSITLQLSLISEIYIFQPKLKPDSINLSPLIRPPIFL